MAFFAEKARVKTFTKNDLTHFMHTIILSEHHTREEPFYVLDLGVVADLMDMWKNALPNIRPFYAVKCNPDPAFLAAMAELGSGFDCASQAEIMSVLALGVNPNSIIFANPCKPESHIKFAASVGVNITTFDSIAEVEKITEFHPNCSLLLRIKPPEDGIAVCSLDSKYGALPEEIELLLRAAQKARLAVIGVAFHIGSGASNMRAYSSAIKAAKTLFDAADRLGMAPMRMLDLGGGFTTGSKFKEAALMIKQALQTHFSESDITVVGEPGRFFAEPAFTLATRIMGKRVRGEKREYWINDGVYGSLLTSVVVEKVKLMCIVLACKSNPKNLECKGAVLYNSTVFGPTCDSFDTVLIGKLLPELEVNDWLVFPNMGAYASAIKSTFNGFNIQEFSTYLAYSN